MIVLETNLFSLIPKIDEMLEYTGVKELITIMPRSLVLEAVREEADRLRAELKNGMDERGLKTALSDLENNICIKSRIKNSFSLKKVVNATGVVIHTNLGRSLIDREVLKQVADTAASYSNLEYDLDEGKRGSRYDHLEQIAAKTVGGEAALVVNNNAAAVMLVLSTIAKDKEVIVSRGELIEIGGAFRIPEVMEQSGAHLVEVGTTNKTHLWDYEAALNENTAAILKVHTSNYRIMGFTSAVDSEELVPLKNKYSIPIIEDLGSGVIIDLSKYGLSYEPTVASCIDKGVDIVTFSGDKLLGGPQAGIIVGKKVYIDRMKKNPLTRALRVDKFTISALEATMRFYLDEETAIKKIPTLRMLTMGTDLLRVKAELLKGMLDKTSVTLQVSVSLEDDFSEVGGGSLPMEKIPTVCVVLEPMFGGATRFEESLRKYDTPVIARIYKERIYLDPRTIQDDELEIVVNAILSAANKLKEC